jgi:hypothetical protein
MNPLDPQIRIARTALALVIGAALIDRCFLHLLNITPAALIACVLVAVTLAAGQRPGAIVKLALMWWTWTAVCVADLLALHIIQASGLQCFLAFLLCGFFTEAAHRQLIVKPQPRRQSTALVPASHDGGVIVIDREAA